MVFRKSIAEHKMRISVTWGSLRFMLVTTQLKLWSMNWCEWWNKNGHKLSTYRILFLSYLYRWDSTKTIHAQWLIWTMETWDGYWLPILLRNLFSWDRLPWKIDSAVKSKWPDEKAASRKRQCKSTHEHIYLFFIGRLCEFVLSLQSTIFTSKCFPSPLWVIQQSTTGTGISCSWLRWSRNWIAGLVV